MAGDWIPYTKDLPKKPQVLRLVRLTGLSLAEVVLALLDFWSWADSESLAGELPGMMLQDVAHIVRTNVRMDADRSLLFVRTMSEVGWLYQDKDGLLVPMFERWMGRSAKRRLLEARRKRNERNGRAPLAPPTGATDPAPSAQCPHNPGQEPALQHRTEQPRGKDSPDTPSCPDTPKPASGPTVLTYPTEGKVKQWDLTQNVLDDLAEAYPALDVLGEARKALAWVQADSAHRKTARGMRAFLTNWMARSQNRGAGRAAPPGKASLESLADKFFGDQQS